MRGNFLNLPTQGRRILSAAFSAWKRTGRTHRKMHAMLTFLLVVSIVTQAIPANATTCATSGNNVTIAANCIFDAGTYTFTGTLTINAGVTVTAASNVGNGQVVIVSDSIVVNGTIDGNATGFAASAGTGQGGDAGPDNGGAGYGGRGNSGFNPTTTGGTTYGSVTAPTDLGSGGGHATAGGAGGGSIKLSATGTITIAGTVRANGGNGSSGTAGGGSGGSVWIDAGTLAGTGTITANGGNGSTWGGGGGGGRIAIHYTSGSPTSYTTQAYGGIDPNCNCRHGGAGTIYHKSSAQTNGDLIIKNTNRSSGAFTTQVTTASQTYDNITIADGSDYQISSGFTLALASGGTLTGGGTVQPLLQIDSGGALNLGNASQPIIGIDVVNNGSVATVTSLTLNDS